MSTPRKMSEKNSSPEISPKRTQGEIEVNDTKKFMSSPEMNIADPGMDQYNRRVPDTEITRAKINTFVNIKDICTKLSRWLTPQQYAAVVDQRCIKQFLRLSTLGWAGQLFHNIVMRLTDHSSMGDALWFEVGEDLGRFSINEFCLITGMKCVGSTHLPLVESRLITRYFSTVRGVSREHLELQLSNAANLDNDDDAVKLSLLYLTFSIPLSNANLVKIDPKFFALADNIAEFNDFPWGVLSWEATRTAICNSVENRVASKRIPLKKNDKVHYSVAGFPHALLVWAYETLPTIALKFSSNYEHAIPRMLSWTTADNVKFDDVMSAFTEVGEKQPKAFVMMPTEEELKDPWVARLYLKNPSVVPKLPPKTPAPPTSSDTNSEWREFQKEIRGEVVSIKKEVVSIKKILASLKKGQTKSNKLMRRVIKMLAANVSEKGQGKGQGEAHTSFHFSSSPETKVQTPESDALKTTPPHIGTGSQYDVILDSALGPVADMGVQAAMEFLTANKVIVSREDVKADNNKENITASLEESEGEVKEKSDPSVGKEEMMPDPENLSGLDKDDKENKKRELDVKQLEEPASEESIGDMIPKKKRVRLSRLGQRPSSSMPHDGSPSKAPNTLIHALPPGLADEPPKEILEEFRAWFPKGLLKKTLTGRYILFSKRPPRYSKTHDTLDKPHDLGCMQVEKKNWYYELATSAVWLWDEHIDVAFYYLRNKIRQFPELNQRKVTTVDTVFTSKVRSLWTVYQSAPDKFNWACCDSIFMIMLGVHVQSGALWWDVNTVLMPIHFEGLKHWALVKLDLTNWTIKVYDSLEHEGPHNSKVREGMEGLSRFIPLVAEKNSLFEFKRRDPPGNYPIPVTIMKDIPKQANGGDCGIFTIKYAECLIEGRDVRYWVIDARMKLFREWMTCYLWAHAKRKLEQSYKSDEDDEIDY
ncbi:hypothetical protein TIFTF001_038170 [Ficus carica]|uniref:Ubiquitin-like protease family profile domain-containing protein n=1 Tax=Ficus carica TaxID=3494 RepID=A0AA88EI47_FICCA|nr:hypothetical protein TIFTF001_038170 [Ficus carica]